MGNLKKLLAVLIVVAMMLTAMMPVFAADEYAATYSTEAETLNALGLMAGSNGDLMLGKDLPREEGITLFLAMFGLTEDAKALSADEQATLLKDFSDVKATDWFAPFVAYAAKLGVTAGVGGGKWGVGQSLTGNAFAKWVANQMGYADIEYAKAVEGLAALDGAQISDVEGLSGAIKRDGAAGIMYGVLGTKAKDDAKTVIQNYVGDNADLQKVAEDAGLIETTPVVVAKALDVSSAVAINSKIVEVTLGTAATADDVKAATFAVKDSAGKAVAVKGAELAAYNTDNEAVLLTLDADTTAGTLYTLTVGAKSVNFGGRAVDTDKPTISSVASTEYNSVKVTFSEPVKFDAAKFTIAEKYGTKAALTVNSFKYGANTEIVLSTADQKGTTLYGITVEGVTDFAGNVMDPSPDDSKTFTGTAKNADDLEVSAGYSNNPEEAVVQFNVRVDAATVTAANFKVEEMYGTKAVLTVTGARLATTDDLGITGAALVDDVTNANDAAKHVILTVPGTKNSTLYKVTVTGVNSAYGKALSTTSGDNNKTFTGTAKPTDPYTVSVGNGGAADNNTQVTVNFLNKVPKADAENIANYAIAEAYGSKAALAITKAELQSGDKSVKLTTAAMKNILYKLTVTNIKDVYENAIKTDDSANVVSFAGAGVASKITKINSIVRDPSNGDTQIIVTFDQSVASDATDVSHYTIDNSVGYPAKAETGFDGSTAAQVRLTIPKTTVGTIYKLTVKGLANADGVAMDTDGVSATFSGQGNAAGLPEMQGVIPLDDQTIEVYFDRDVTNSTIDNTSVAKIWRDDNNSVIAGALGIVDITHPEAGLLDIGGMAGEYAYQDPDNKNGLIIRLPNPVSPATEYFLAAKKNASLGAFKLVGATGKFDADNKALVFAPNDNDPTKVSIDALMAMNKNVVRVYFNQAVKIPAVASFGKIGSASASTYAAGSATTLSSAKAIDNTNKIWDISLGGTALTSATYYFNLNSGITTGSVADVTGMYTFDTAADATIQWQFAGSGSTASDITDVSVVMTDKKTIVIYYPEAMNADTSVDPNWATSVINPANYDIVNGAAVPVAVTMNDNTPFNEATDIADISYDGDSTSATFNTVKITLNQPVKTAAGGAFLNFNTGIKNAVLTASVVDGATQISKQFALSGGDAALLSVSSVTYDADTGLVTVKLNQKAIGTTLNAGNLLSYFTVTINNGTAVTVVSNVTGLPTGLTAATGSDTIKFQIDAPAMISGDVGSVVFNSAQPGGSNVTGINAEAVDTDASAQTFAQ